MFRVFGIVSVLLLIIYASCSRTGNDKAVVSGEKLKDSIVAGKRIFENTCVRCHGMDASGLTGPSLRRHKLIHAPDRESFTTVVEGGIAGTGMAGNWAVTDDDAHQIYAYVQSLKSLGNEVISGDTLAGKQVYLRYGCSNCHTVKGAGGALGPDLSLIGASRNAAYLRQSLTDPGAALPNSVDQDNGYGFSLYLPVRVVTLNGKEINGIRINEDTYSIQLKDDNNKYYSFDKDQLKILEKKYGQSLMPSFKNALTADQIENLVAYLHNLQDQ
jgi:cytochrome c oxidase cbb3-type subunit III